MGELQVSVVLLTHNHQQTVRRALESLQTQSAAAYEVLCIDAGSTDRTFDLLQTAAERDIHVEVSHIESSDLSVALSHGLARARGRFVTVLEGDTWAEPTLIEELCRAMLRLEEIGTRSPRFVLGGMALTYGDADPIEAIPSPAQYLSASSCKAACESLLTRSVLLPMIGKLFETEALRAITAHDLHTWTALYAAQTQAAATVDHVVIRAERSYIPAQSIELAHQALERCESEAAALEQLFFASDGYMPHQAVREALATRYVERCIACLRRANLPVREKQRVLSALLDEHRMKAALELVNPQYCKHRQLVRRLQNRQIRLAAVMLSINPARELPIDCIL